MKKLFFLALMSVMTLSITAQKVTIPAGTTIICQLVNNVRASKVKVGDKVDFIVSRNVVVDGKTVVKYGTPIKGTVYKANCSSWWGTKGKLGIKIDNIDLQNGYTIPLRDADLYVTGKNRTALSVILFTFVAIPCCFITGTRAEVAAGYEVYATVSNDTEVRL